MSRRRRRSGRSNANSNAPANNGAVDAFWEEPGEDPAPAEPIRPTPDPGAIPRSLGDPPLTPDATAQHHLAVVYEEAVRAATALAAANGLLADEQD